MAEIFSYQNMMDKTNLKRSSYWTGQKAEDLFEANKEHQNELLALNTTGYQQSQLDMYKDRRLKSIGNKAQLFAWNQLKGTNLKGNFSLSETWENVKDPTRKWGTGDPVIDKNKWWYSGKGSTYKPTAKWNAVDVSKLSKADKLLVKTGKAPSGMKLVDGKLVTKNPEWSFGKGLANIGNKMANTGYAKAVAGASPAVGVVGVVGAGYKMLADDKDPTTYTSNEAMGDTLSWGATAFQVAMMIPGIGPYLAIPAAIAAALISTSAGKKAAGKAKFHQDTAKRKWDAEILAFQKRNRKINKIEGNAPLQYNWWDTKYS